MFRQSSAFAAKNRVIGGPNSSTATNRAICMAITNEASTLLEAAMIATESAPPGLVAR